MIEMYDAIILCYLEYYSANLSGKYFQNCNELVVLWLKILYVHKFIVGNCILCHWW